MCSPCTLYVYLVKQLEQKHCLTKDNKISYLWEAEPKAPALSERVEVVLTHKNATIEVNGTADSMSEIFQG